MRSFAPVCSKVTIVSTGFAWSSMLNADVPPLESWVNGRPGLPKARALGSFDFPCAVRAWRAPEAAMSLLARDLA